MMMPKTTYLQRPAVLIELADESIREGRYRQARLQMGDARWELRKGFRELRAEEKRRGGR